MRDNLTPLVVSMHHLVPTMSTAPATPAPGRSRHLRRPLHRRRTKRSPLHNVGSRHYDARRVCPKAQYARDRRFDRTRAVFPSRSAAQEMELPLDRCAGGLIREPITDVLVQPGAVCGWLVSGLTGPQNDVSTTTPASRCWRLVDALKTHPICPADRLGRAEGRLVQLVPGPDIQGSQEHCLASAQSDGLLRSYSPIRTRST